MLIDIIRSVLVFAHLLLFSGAFVLVLVTDFSILKNGVNKESLNVAVHRVLTLFILLWLTGLLMLYIDTGFVVDTILSNSKLVLKLLSVFILTLNGVILHLLGVSILLRTDKLSHKQAMVICIIGALSTTNWLVAGFVGSANVLTQIPHQTLLSHYFLILLLACLIGLLLSKNIQRRINMHRASAELAKRGMAPIEVAQTKTLVRLFPTISNAHINFKRHR